MLHLTEKGPFLQLNHMPVKATSKINLICIEKNTTSLIFVNEGQSLITRPLCGTQALNKPRSSLLVFGAKNGQKTNRMCMDLISRFVVRAQKLIFRCRPSGLGEADQVMPNMAPMYVGHRPPLLCQRERVYEWPIWACAALKHFPTTAHVSALLLGDLFPFSRKHNMREKAHSTDYI